MRVAFDLRYASDHFPGIGTHAWALACELARQEAFDELVLLWRPGTANSRFDFAPLRAQARVRWHEVNVPALSIGTASGTGVALERLGVDAYLSPFWLRPEGTRVPCVLTLHDVIPLALPDAVSAPRRLAYRWAMRRAAG